MKAQSKTIEMAIGVVFNNCYIYWGGVEQPGVKLFQVKFREIRREVPALSLANTEDTEIIINELASEIPETAALLWTPDNYHESKRSF